METQIVKKLNIAKLFELTEKKLGLTKRWAFTIASLLVVASVVELITGGLSTTALINLALSGILISLGNKCENKLLHMKVNKFLDGIEVLEWY